MMRRLLRLLPWTLALLLTLPVQAQDAAFSADGQGYATADDVPAVNLSGTGYAIEVWVKHDGTSAEDAIILTKGNDENASHYTLRFVGAGEEVPVLFAVRYGTGVRSTSGIPADRWTHIAAVYDGTQLALYINGELDATSSFSRDQDPIDLPLRIGTNSSANGQFFSGQIDELRLWSVPRAFLEVKSEMYEVLNGNEAGLAAYWSFNGEAPLTGETSAAVGLTATGDAGISTPGALPVPPDLHAMAKNGQVKLTWNQRPDAEPATTFKLYRSTVPDGSDRVEVATISGGTTSYTDTDVENGTTYHYEVTGIDSEGSESDFSSAAAVQPYASRGGHSLALGGQGYATASNRPSLDLSGTEYAVEVWVKHDGSSDENAYILTKGTDDLAYHYTLSFVGAGEEVPVHFANRYGSGVTSTSGIPAGQWTHIAAVYDGAQLALYINGRLDATTPFDRDQEGNDMPLRIGTNNSANGQFFSGQLDEIRIWSIARSAEEVEDHYRDRLTGSEEGLEAYWRFSGATEDAAFGAGTTHQTLDIVGDAQVAPGGVVPLTPDVFAIRGDGQAEISWDERSAESAAQYKLYRLTTPDGSDRTEVATIAAGTTSYTDTDVENGTTYFYEVTSVDASGQESDYGYPAPATPSTHARGNALQLDGDGDFARVSDRPSLNLMGTDFAVEAWIKHDGGSDPDAVILGKGTSDNAYRYELRLEGGGDEVPVGFYVRYGTGVTSTTTIPAGEWTHVAGVYDGAQLALYVNGELDATTDFSRDQEGNDMPLMIGSNAAGDGEFFSGVIDEVRIWDDPRTGDELQSNMNRSLVGNEDGLVAYWRFNETAGSVAHSSAGRPKSAELRGDASFTAVTGTAIERPTAELPTQVELKGNYPNPFNPATTIRYALPEAMEVRLEIFDALGRRVAVLIAEDLQTAGAHEVTFDAGHLPSGLYLYRLRAGDDIRVRRMTLVK